MAMPAYFSSKTSGGEKWTWGWKVVFMIVLLSTGSADILINKFADITCARGSAAFNKGLPEDRNQCEDRSLGAHSFDHPFVQSLFLFMGMTLSRAPLLVARVVYKKEMAAERWRPWWMLETHLFFMIAAFVDYTANTLSFFGLILTDAGQYQMLRGSVVLFNALLSRVVFRRQLRLNNWVGIVFATLGLVLIGVSAYRMGRAGDAPDPLLGDAIIVATQLLKAVHLVMEEYLIHKCNVHQLDVLGYQGFYATGFSAIACVILMFVSGSRAGRLEDINDAFLQLAHDWRLRAAMVGFIFNAAVYIGAGITLTKYIDSTARVVIEQLRTITVWCLSLAVGWETFSYIQAAGFFLLALGTIIYHNFVRWPSCWAKKPWRRDDVTVRTEEQSDEERAQLLVN